MTTIELKYLDKITDRYTRDHYYFRHRGRRVPLPGKPMSAEFMAAYGAALNAATHVPTERPTKTQPAAGTFLTLAALYFASANFLNLSPSSRRNYRRVIDGFLAKHGAGRLDQFRRRHMIKIVGEMSDVPGAAIVLLKRVRTLVRFAILRGAAWKWTPRMAAASPG